MSVLLVLCMVPNEAAATAIAHALVEERLAACVNCLPGAVSTFRWEGRVQSEAELLLLIKTTTACFDALSARIVALHPYELPEVIAVDVSHGLDRYLIWVGSETRPSTGVPGGA